MEAEKLLADGWSYDWGWGLPLIVLTVVVHGFGLIGIHSLALRSERARRRLPRSIRFAILVSATTLLLTALHALEAGAWAAAYVLIGAAPNPHSAMLYSLNAMTTYGHASIFLSDRWRFLGALEALNGMMLFGLTTAFLFAALRVGWMEESGADGRPL